MKGIELAGLVLTVEEWQDLDQVARAQIVAAVMQWEDPSTGVGETEPARTSSPAIPIPVL